MQTVLLRCSSYTMLCPLTGSSANYLFLAHALRQQDLSDHIVDLVCAGVI